MTVAMAVVFFGSGGFAAGWKWRIGFLLWLSLAAVAVASAVLVLRHGAWPMVPPAMPWLALAGAWWAFVPRATLPRNRVRRQTIRLHLRLHPGRGHATAVELHRHWGRLGLRKEGDVRQAVPVAE